jgi:hypothetical protein
MADTLTTGPRTLGEWWALDHPRIVPDHERESALNTIRAELDFLLADARPNLAEADRRELIAEHLADLLARLGVDAAPKASAPAENEDP